MDQILLSQTCSSLSPQLSLPQRQHWKGQGKKKKLNTLNRNRKADISTWDAVHRQEISFPTAAREQQKWRRGRSRPAFGERLFPVLLHCAKWGGSRRAPCLPAALASPRYLGGAGMASRALLTHTWAWARLGLAPPAPALPGEQPPANLGPGEEERLGLLWGTGSLAQRLIRQAKPSQLRAAHPAPHSPSLARATRRSLGGKNGAKPVLPARIFLLPCICYLSLKCLGWHTVCSHCLGVQEVESPRDHFEMVPGRFSSQGESRSSGHGRARQRLVTSHPPHRLPSRCPRTQPPRSTGSMHPEEIGYLFPQPNQGRKKIQVGKKGREKVSLWQRLPSTGGRD